ncbi:hypothetical protein KL921_001427 [Ogataea angusta]|uniref:Exosome complex protein n=1 Tax=Pichia angusta TaxID=870730 RepID=A0AAN6DER2_PICAN|nr:uncharacterized protein KL928_002664 [Ogataea angusta]KAG7812195.1 hypothetical protein KL921_001427 [Ogataea angusta]KAG7818796.1 hypothetical protein KL928_002664 [Ogataea angusta]KAG7834639.1 hypothetical protein KL943_003023 [Ogataea angusta]KAG7841665.1 hypothetical protein KL942_001544 [Ogataea angusta]KAG7848150.1 hypothetical protein KL941_002329 [Ogataea angusta]
MDDIDAVKKLLASLNHGVEDLETKLKSGMLAKSLLNHVQGAKTPLEKVDLYNNYAYVIASLYFVLLKTSGENKKNEHPIMQELNRVKLYIERAKKAVTKEENTEEFKRKVAEAAERHVRNQLGEKIEPAVSKVHFEGKHTKFGDKEGSETEKPTKKRKTDSDDSKDLKKSKTKNKKSKATTSKK